MSLTAPAQLSVASRELTPSIGFVIATTQPVAVHTPVTLADMTSKADALASAAWRAESVLKSATAKRGKDAENLVTRVSNSKALIPVLAGVGLAAAAGTAAACWPDSHKFYETWRGWYHVDTEVWRTWYDLGAIAIGAASGALLAGAAYFGLKTYAPVEKARMARDQLRLPDVQALETMFEAAKERPLERAALGGVAREALSSLKSREIFKSQDVTALLERMAAQADVGDADAVAEANRHRTFIAEVRCIERWGADERRVASFIAAFQNLTEAERHSVAPEVLNRLFDEAVPRSKDVSFAEAESLRAAILAALTPPASEQPAA